MQKFYLVETVTKDKLIHQGIYFEPKKKSKRAILWIHGLTDNFYGDLKTLLTFAKFCEKEGWGFASFNTRGHDIVTSISKIDKRKPKGKTSVTLGSAYEKFTDCIHDIDAGIAFLEKQSYKHIILIGISTGANKVCYYVGTKNDKRVEAVVLASPISDVAIKRKELQKKYFKVLDKVKSLVKTGKKNRLLEGIDYMPLTPRRFLSLYAVNSDEDVFPYYQNRPSFTTFSKITKPLIAIMGEKDEYADMPVAKIVDSYKKYQKSKHYNSVIIPDAFHSFQGKEKEFVETIVAWMKIIY